MIGTDTIYPILSTNTRYQIKQTDNDKIVVIIYSLNKETPKFIIPHYIFEFTKSDKDCFTYSEYFADNDTQRIKVLNFLLINNIVFIYSRICKNNCLYFIGTIYFTLINNIYLIEEIIPTNKCNISNDNYKEINELIENNYIEKINHNKFKYKLGSRTILELI